MEKTPVDCGEFFCGQFNELSTTSTAGQATGVLKRFVVQTCKITTWLNIKREKHLAEKREKPPDRRKKKREKNHLAEVALEEKGHPCATHCDHEDERALKYHIENIIYPLKSNQLPLKRWVDPATSYHIECTYINKSNYTCYIIHYTWQCKTCNSVKIFPMYSKAEMSSKASVWGNKDIFVWK